MPTFGGRGGLNDSRSAGAKEGRLPPVLRGDIANKGVAGWLSTKNLYQSNFPSDLIERAVAASCAVPNHKLTNDLLQPNPAADPHTTLLKPYHTLLSPNIQQASSRCSVDVSVRHKCLQNQIASSKQLPRGSFAKKAPVADRRLDRVTLPKSCASIQRTMQAIAKEEEECIADIEKE